MNQTTVQPETEQFHNKSCIKNRTSKHNLTKYDSIKVNICQEYSLSAMGLIVNVDVKFVYIY